jgi:uncharacterized membrane protein
MRPSGMHYFPLAWPFLAGLGLLLLFVLALVELRVLRYAYEKVGISPRVALFLLLASLLGSYVNLPVAELPPERVMSDREIIVGWMHYRVPPVEDWHRTIIAVNVGGAIIPLILSLTLLVRNQLYFRGIVATAIVAAVVHHLAQPVKGIGITVPPFAPPILAAVVSMILSWRKAAPLAYIAGSMGTLIGADLMNLDKIGGLGAPIASIGGAGTFDGVFLAGILAVLLAPALRTTPPPRPPEPPSSPDIPLRMYP